MLFLLLALVFQCCTAYQTSGTQAISYHIYGDGQTSSACYPTQPASNWAGYVTANTFSLPCGTCVQMSLEDNSSKYIYVTAIDIGGKGFDLNLPAFCELCRDDGGLVQGSCNINWNVVDNSYCTNWNAGKTKPNCPLCAAGSTCGNPGGGAGVDWATYCSGVAISDGQSVSMTRCDILDDGCTCTGGSSTTVPVPVPTPVAPVPTPVTKSTGTGSTKGQTATRCGVDWGTANSGCYKDCANDGDCTSDQPHCWASLSMTPCSSGLVTDDSSMTETGDSKSLIIGISVGVGLLLLAVIVIAIFMVKRRRMEEIV